MTLPARDRIRLKLQRLLGLVCYPVLGNLLVALMRFAMGYRILELRQLRKRVQALVGEHKHPLLICANHLTRIDSAIVAWALASNWTYLFRYWMFPWNMPDRRNYERSRVLRVVCYLMKCVPVVRMGPQDETKRTMEKLRFLLERKEVLFIFPEGTRSDTGRVDTEDFGYGVGRLFNQVPDARVLCVYQRGLHQRQASSLPRRGEVFYTDLALIHPATEAKGLRAARDISTQIVHKLHEMEQAYFENGLHRQ